ncbi:TetR-like C-terminal domain-containing protein, partial [Trinickia caryophylli]|uniref:TetR-like C-terminal domain-containing protein n=1 Tax=Trinickia caryophylli TaxID=28094 RepID=UPI001E4007B2
HKDFLQRMEDKQNKKNPSAMDYSFTYMVHGSMSVINQWLESNGDESARDIASIISSLTQSTIEHRRSNPYFFS